MRKTYVFWTILSLTLVFSLIPPAISAKAVYLIVPSSDTEVSSNSSIWAGYPLLKRICAAESNYGPENEPRQFLPDGSLLWGWDGGKIVKRDVGACQINTLVWGSTAARMGLDIVNSQADNITFAKWLFAREGWRPWIASKPHWDPDGVIH